MSEPDALNQLEAELAQLDAAIAAQEQLASTLPPAQQAVLQATLAILQEQRASLQSRLTVVRDGAVAEGYGATALGAGATQVQIRGNVYLGPPTQDPAEALRIYREVLASASRHLPLRGVDLEASDPGSGGERLDLAQVYVDLDTRTQVPLSDEEQEERRRSRPEPEMRETRPLPILEAMVANRRLVVLGDPGSGKTTFLSHLAFCLAVHGLEPEKDWLARLACWPEAEAGALPIPVVLRDFARWLPGDLQRAEPRHLWAFIVSRLEAQNLAFAAEPLCRALEGGQAVVLLDGLDEIPTGAERALVRDAVSAFARRYGRSRLVVSCRTLSYQDPAWQLPDFPAFELAPFDEAKIDRFIEAWYAELARLGTVKAGEAGGLARRLRGAVRRPDLWRLASNPLLLTVMALVHTHKGHLPDARALLYEDTVDILLWRWEQIKAGGEEQIPRLRALLLEAGRTDVDLKRVLWRLAYESHQAFEAHRQGGAGDDADALADIDELELQKALAALHPQDSHDWARKLIGTMRLRAGLLLERVPGTFTFPHRTFQEYLAGAHLSAQAGFAKQASALVEEGAFWREVVLLAVGRLVYLGGDTDKPLALAGELCPAREVDDILAWQKAWLAGEVLVEMGLHRVRDSALGQDLAERVRHRLVAVLERGRLTAVERAATGRALSRLGDPRPGVGVHTQTGLPDTVWCEVPAGSFLMGSSDADSLAYSDEKPQHEQNIPYSYWVARYPITNAQFAAFVAAGGYGEQRYWREAEKAGYWHGGHIETPRDGKGRDRPADAGEPFRLPNHPVVNVSWYEALAFCRWLTETMPASGSRQQVWRAGRLETLDLDFGKRQVRLPAEAEWEKAARGPAARSGQALVFPWGSEADPERANYGDTGIGTTSATGCFPGGESPYGVLDLSGNVWEWTHSLWGTSYGEPDFGYPYRGDDGREVETAGPEVLRVLRGGAFYDGQRLVRCAFRLRSGPNLWGRSIGFRVVVAPGLPLGAGASGR